MKSIKTIPVILLLGLLLKNCYAQDDTIKTKNWSLGVNYTNIISIFKSPHYGYVHQFNTLLKCNKVSLVLGLEYQQQGIFGKHLGIRYQIYSTEMKKYKIEIYNTVRNFNYRIGAGPPIGILPTKNDHYDPYVYEVQTWVIDVGGIYSYRILKSLFIELSVGVTYSNKYLTSDIYNIKTYTKQYYLSSKMGLTYSFKL